MNFVRDGLSVFGLLACSGLFLDFEVWNDLSAVSAIYGEEASIARFSYLAERWGWTLAMLGPCFADGNAREGPSVPILMGCSAVGMLCAVGVPYWAHWRRRKSPEPLHLARGALFDGIHAVRQKVGIGRNITICILPDKFQAKSAAYDSSSTASVAMPRCLLERLSRPEIDALAAFQLIWHRTFRFKRYAFFGVLLYGSISSISLYTQGTGARGRWLVFLLQAIAEIVVLRVLWRRHIDGIHLAAMEVSGNPDAYVSAMVELSSLGGGAVDARLLRRLFRIAGSTQRMDAFLVESPRRKEDRYPTSGDYLAVGF